jgi:hypothetical protein
MQERPPVSPGLPSSTTTPTSSTQNTTSAIAVKIKQEVEEPNPESRFVAMREPETRVVRHRQPPQLFKAEPSTADSRAKVTAAVTTKPSKIEAAEEGNEEAGWVQCDECGKVCTFMQADV